MFVGCTTIPVGETVNEAVPANDWPDTLGDTVTVGETGVVRLAGGVYIVL
jgi:hypothetical protein